MTAVWQIDFGPTYTPKQMLELGVFEGKYINNMKGIPADWKKLPKVLGKDGEPDPSINKFGVKSRQPLSTWKENGWIKTDANGWFVYTLVQLISIYYEFQTLRIKRVSRMVYSFRI
jgi:hypothetical protein